ncbi:mfs transporter [Ophiostoma piceae UAMH 11346]|uniref:Mfs transporter n=1 Tax=Ophiostoma piceae (strain UAMH 11346) TaxID=1262450 RepID=S3DAL2_OPHP1|nr:mfs transporter [Ophiostoma piceae UAMH 11346]
MSVAGVCQFVLTASQLRHASIDRPGLFHLPSTNKSTFITFLFIFELGNLVAGLAVSSVMVIVGRAITGIGASGILTGVTAIITTIRPLEKRPMLIGIIMGGVAMGQVGGPLIGGALAQISWRWVFYINLPFGGIVMLLFLFVIRLPASPKQQKQLEAMAAHAANYDPTTVPSNLFKPTIRQKLAFYKAQLARIDFPGFVCFAAGCALFLMGLEWGGTQYAWDSATVIGLLVGGSVLFVIFGAWSVHLGDRALIPPRLLRYGRINVFCGVTALTQAASVFVLMAYLPIWFQGIKGATPIMSGVMLLPTIIAQLAASILCGFLVQKTGYYLPEILVGNSLVSIASGLFTTFTPSTSTGQWIGFQILGGVGRGFVMQLLITVIQANVAAADIPLGVSYVMFCQYFGGAVFICAARTVLTSTIGAELLKYAPNVDADLVVATGITELRKVIPAGDIDGVLKAYNAALVNVAKYLQLALSGTALVSSSFLGWRDIRKAQPAPEKMDTEQANNQET